MIRPWFMVNLAHIRPGVFQLRGCISQHMLNAGAHISLQYVASTAAGSSECGKLRLESIHWLSYIACQIWRSGATVELSSVHTPHTTIMATRVTVMQMMTSLLWCMNINAYCIDMSLASNFHGVMFIQIPQVTAKDVMYWNWQTLSQIDTCCHILTSRV